MIIDDLMELSVCVICSPQCQRVRENSTESVTVDKHFKNDDIYFI